MPSTASRLSIGAVPWSVALLAPGARPAAAQGWPFMFTVTTEPARAEARWIARYEGG